MNYSNHSYQLFIIIMLIDCVTLKLNFEKENDALNQIKNKIQLSS